MRAAGQKRVRQEQEREAQKSPKSCCISLLTDDDSIDQRNGEKWWDAGIILNMEWLDLVRDGSENEREIMVALVFQLDHWVNNSA